jgi:hypothetical protein
MSRSRWVWLRGIVVSGAATVMLLFVVAGVRPSAAHAQQVPFSCEAALGRIANLTSEIAQREREFPIPPELKAELERADQAQRTARAELKGAETAVERARQRFASDPSLSNGQDLTNAKNELDRAQAALKAAEQDVRDANTRIGNDPNQHHILRLKGIRRELQAEAKRKGCRCDDGPEQLRTRHAVIASCTVGTPKKPPAQPKPVAADPCRASPAPCFVQIEVNGFPPGAEDQEDWGDGIVTVDSATPQPTFAQEAGFIAGSWAAQFNPEPGCADGYDAINECYQFEWYRSDTVVLTAYPVPAGGFSADPTPEDESPGWDSTFAGWGGDCADAGTSTTCTLHLGRQRPSTGTGGQSGYSLDVTAFFAAAQVSLG